MRQYLAILLLASASAWAAGTAKAPVPTVVNGKTVMVQPAPLDFAPFASSKDVHMYRAADKDTGAGYTLVSGNVICHSPYPDSTIKVEVSLFVTHATGIFEMGTFSTAIERIAPGKVVPFKVLCDPACPEAELKWRLDCGGKLMYTVRLQVSRFVPKP